MQQTVSFTLAVRGAARAVEFYVRAFGAIEVARTASPDGDVVAQLEIAGHPIFVADEAPEHGNFSPASLGDRTSVRLALVVSDPDAVAARAIAAGAVSVAPVEDQPYGWRLGRVVDPFGHHWEIGRPLHDHH